MYSIFFLNRSPIFHLVLKHECCHLCTTTLILDKILSALRLDLVLFGLRLGKYKMLGQMVALSVIEMVSTYKAL